MWECEWQLPFVRCPLRFIADDVFVGSCPDEETDKFERIVEGALGFVDPRRNMKYYAAKLEGARARLGINVSVV